MSFQEDAVKTLKAKQKKRSKKKAGKGKLQSVEAVVLKFPTGK